MTAPEAGVRAEVSDGVARLVIDRPPHNLLDVATAHELLQAATAIDEDQSVRCVVLTGAGGTFSSGGDITAFAAAGPELPLLLKELTTYLHAAIARLARMRAPVIAAVEGVAAGGGFSLAISADLLLAARSATFHYAYSRIGMSPDGSSTYHLPRIVGQRRAMQLALLDRGLTAEEALAWGLVTEVVEDGDLPGAVRGLAGRIAAGPTAAHAAAKRLFLESWTTPLETQMERESREIADTARTVDAAEGISAFLDRRRPDFTGR